MVLEENYPENIILNPGDVLGFETDTVWGLGCLPDDRKAVDKIYEIKGRDRSKPLILMSDSLKNLLPYVSYIPDYAKNLIKQHFPGALTLIFKKTELTESFITSGFDTVGIRVPSHEGFQKLVRKLAKPLSTGKNTGSTGDTAKLKPCRVLATTSLNLSGENPVKNYDEAKAKFSDRVRIIEPGTGKNGAPAGVSSTVVLCIEDVPRVLRQGSIKISN